MEIQDLKDKIISASQDYYAGKTIMSDDEFDTLVEQLRVLSPDDELLTTIGYGYQVTETEGQKAKHKYQSVGSLDKINSSTCDKYFEKHPGVYCITSKIDGGSIVVYYNSHGRLEKAITRGNGEVGIDCTTKLKYLVPGSINLTNIAVRGEITIDKNLFTLYYPDKASPRNTAVGLIGRDEVGEEEIKRLTFIAYDVYGDNENVPKTKSQKMQWLLAQGFTFTKWYRDTLDGNESQSSFLEGMKNTLDPQFPSDGIVLTMDDNPSESIAYKFEAETAETAVTSVEWEVSRLGYLIPVVHFNPVKLSGAILSKCSGFNARWIKNNSVGIGARIIIHRAGEVIPYIKEVLQRTGTYLPDKCPTCLHTAYRQGVHLHCPNRDCPGKAKYKLLLWYETLARIDALGENILAPFFPGMGWKEIIDIYKSQKDLWKTIVSQFATKHARKLLWRLYDKLYEEPVDPKDFFAAFGLPAVGKSTSKKISEEIGIEKYFSGDALNAQTLLEKLSGTTKPGKQSLQDNYQEMRQVYLTMADKTTGPGFILSTTHNGNIKIAITGKLSKSRKELIDEFSMAGIEVVDSISKETKFLITDDPCSGSSKNLKAQKLGIKVISEITFRKEMKL